MFFGFMVDVISSLNYEFIIVLSDPNLCMGLSQLLSAQKAGLHEVPVVVTNTDDLKSLEFAIIENVQRNDLNVIEEAQGFNRVVFWFKLFWLKCFCSSVSVSPHLGRGAKRGYSRDYRECIAWLSLGHLIQASWLGAVRTFCFVT